MLRTAVRPTEAAFAGLAVLLIYVAFLGHGASPTPAALILVAAEALLMLALLAPSWSRHALRRGRGLARPAIAFGLVLLVALWSLTPFTPGGANPAWTYVGGAGGVLGASALDRSAVLVELIKLFGAASVFVIGYGLARSDDRARLVINLLLYAGGLYALWALALFAGVSREYGPSRLSADFLSPNTAGSVFAALTVLAMSAALSAARRRDGDKRKARLAEAAPFWALALLFAAVLFLTASRGAALAAGAGLLAFFVLEAFGGRFHIKTAGATLIGAGALLALQGPFLISRMTRGSTDTGQRQDLFSIHWKAFLDSPLFGYGLGSFDAAHKLRLDQSNFRWQWNVRAAHNVYLQWLEQAGIVGALPMFATIGLIIWGAFRGVERRRRSKGLLRGLIAVDAVFLVHGWADFALEVPAVTAFWALILGLQLGLANATTARGRGA
jgi:O-antigen ligase